MDGEVSAGGPMANCASRGVPHSTLVLAILVAVAGSGAAQPEERSRPEGVLGTPVQATPGPESPAAPRITGFRLSPLAGEPVNGFPSWQERVLHEWMNRARVAPQAEMAACGANCPDGPCYAAVAPLVWNGNVGRAARFHADEMARQRYFAHDSACTVVSNISSLYPATCSGSASCACVGGASTCNAVCTSWDARISLFGTAASGENIAAGYGSVSDAFFAWLYEPASSTSCGFSSANGHRWNLLTQSAAVGMGYVSVAGAPYTRYYVNDFGGANGPIPKIPSGAHYPQQGDPIEFWANWYDAAAPRTASVNVDGVCHPMSLQRGTATNGAYSASVTGLGSGCHRYYFSFVDSSGATVTYPSTGSYGIGTTACADWDVSRPASCSTGSPPPSSGRFYPLTPCRLVDTRNPAGPFGGPALGFGEVRPFAVATGACGIPADAVGISLNVTVADASAAGTLTFFPGSGTVPGTNTISFVPGKNRANDVTMGLVGGVVSVKNNQSTGTVNLIVDVNGYYR